MEIDLNPEIFDDFKQCFSAYYPPPPKPPDEYWAAAANDMVKLMDKWEHDPLAEGLAIALYDALERKHKADRKKARKQATRRADRKE